MQKNSVSPVPLELIAIVVFIDEGHPGIRRGRHLALPRMGRNVKKGSSFETQSLVPFYNAVSTWYIMYCSL